MSSFIGIPTLPFWILGVPLVIAMISYVRTPKHRDLATSDQRRNNLR